jgi:cytochrome c
MLAKADRAAMPAQQAGFPLLHPIRSQTREPEILNTAFARDGIRIQTGRVDTMENRNNIIAGWVLGAGIVALGSSILFGKMFHGEVPHEGHEGYAIVAEEAAPTGAAVVPLATLLASGDAAKGAETFKKCVACHTIDAGAANGTGPNLHGVLGKAKASHAGFSYSDGLKGKGGNWTIEELNEWLTSTTKFAPGTKMNFALPKPEDRANVILYINSQGSNLPLPAPPAEGAAPVAGADAAKTDVAAPAAKAEGAAK